MDYSVLEQVEAVTVVSLPGIKGKPLYSSYIMSRMAYAAKEEAARFGIQS